MGNILYNKQGFTLVELAVVLVIIAFIVSGIVGGQTLVHNARLTSVLTSMQTYKQATSAFKERYKALPGDFRRATDFWTDAMNCGRVDVPPDGDCGNGRIDDAATEGIEAWFELAASEEIPGSYTGQNAADNNLPVPGLDIPESSFKGGGFLLAYLSTGTGPAIPTTSTAMPGNYVRFGTPTGAGAGTASLLNAVITPQESAAMDTKIDDSFADSGIFLSIDGGNAGPANAPYGDCVNGGVYVLTDDRVSCQSWLRMD